MCAYTQPSQALNGLVQTWLLVYQDKKACKQLDATINMQLGQPVPEVCDHNMEGMCNAWHSHTIRKRLSLV